VITLGSRTFAGPFLAPLWSAPAAAGVFAVMVPGWRLMTFRAIHFGQTGDFSSGFLKSQPRYAEWLRIAGTEWNLYIATHEMSFSTQAQREAAAGSTARGYRPEFAPPAHTHEMPALSTMLLARAMRAQQE
jgi:hypothetical protein